MMTINSLIIALILIGGYHAVRGLNDDACVNSMLLSTHNGIPACSVMVNYARCVIRESGPYVYATDANDRFIQQRSLLAALMKEQGVACDIDFESLAYEIRDEDRRVFVRPSMKLAVFKNAATDEECLHTYNNVIRAGCEPCSATALYAKCVIKVHNVLKLNIEHYEDLGHTLENDLAKHGVQCRIDVRSLVEEILREQLPSSTYGLVVSKVLLITMLEVTLLAMFFYF